eukprot:Colp12_sorted_trinity150504_noHs@20881
MNHLDPLSSVVILEGLLSIIKINTWIFRTDAHVGMSVVAAVGQTPRTKAALTAVFATVEGKTTTKVHKRGLAAWATQRQGFLHNPLSKLHCRLLVCIANLFNACVLQSDSIFLLSQ